MSTTISSIALEGPLGSGKTSRLLLWAEAYCKHDAFSSLLVLCSHSSRKKRFLEALQSKLDGGHAQFNVMTYPALVRQTLAMFWPLVEAELKIGHPVIFPELTGFDSSEYLFQMAYEQLYTQNPTLFGELKMSPQSIQRQLLRRLRLRSENRLSRGDMTARSQLIEELAVEEGNLTLQRFEALSLHARVFDGARQLDIFHHLLETNPTVQAHFRDNFTGLIVDDVDETIPAQQHFVKWLASSIKHLAFAADIDGGSRRGYLNAYPYDWPGLKTLRSDIELLRLTPPVHHDFAAIILKNWKHLPWTALTCDSLPNPSPYHLESIASQRIDMLEQVVAKLSQLLTEGVSPGALALVLPQIDLYSQYILNGQLAQLGVSVQTLTGTTRPIDHPISRSLVLLLQWVNLPTWQVPLTSIELKTVLQFALKLHILSEKSMNLYIQRARQMRYQTGGLSLLPVLEDLSHETMKRLNKLHEWLKNAAEQPLSSQFYSAFREVIAPYLLETDSLQDVSALAKTLDLVDLAQKLNPQARAEQCGLEWLKQVKRGSVATTPSQPVEVDPNAIVIGTPQKMIDFEIKRPHYFWLDLTSREWSRTDNAPLYNAWVHSVNWTGTVEEADDSFNQHLAYVRAGHITRTLALLARDTIYGFASDLDNEGNTNTGVFLEVLKQDVQTEHTFARATLREDQQEVLLYQGGPMAISAVPGAGKTFINVEFILELISRGVPANQICILTYMDSAAKTLQARLKAKLGGSLSTLPVISTIHSLAFRILSEGDHAQYIGLDGNTLAVADDFKVQDLLIHALNLHDPNRDFFKRNEEVMSLIKHLKSHRISPEAYFRTLKLQQIPGGPPLLLGHIYQSYQNLLAQQGELDFSDIITSAVGLLESRQDVRELYQSRFRYMIEDEAQDSSLLLQEFLHLLLNPDHNLIRTGDTNQSITTTYSSSDTRVFREFISRCEQSGSVITMTHSGRCAPAIIGLANDFIAWAGQDPELKNAFHPVSMEAVSGVNPNLLTPICCTGYDTITQEQDALCDGISRFTLQHPTCSIAVLIRYNADGHVLTKKLQDAGLKAVCLSESPEMQPAFLFLVALLELFETPSSSAVLARVIRGLMILGCLPYQEDVIALASEAPEWLLQDSRHIPHPSLLTFYYHYKDLSRESCLPNMSQLVMRITELFFTHSGSRSLGYLCALQIEKWQRLVGQDSGQLPISTLEWVNQQLKRCVERKKLPFKSIQEEGLHDAPGLIQVMTLHKAKGQEFDAVWIPGLTESKHPSQIHSVRKTSDLKHKLDHWFIHPEQSIEQITQLRKVEQIEEEARLMYVGITRAKQALFLSSHEYSTDYRGKLKPETPSRYFEACQRLSTQAVAMEPLV
jgi:DNA helicase II / ATP-dependent DNA helicase PcrA